MIHRVARARQRVGVRASSWSPRWRLLAAEDPAVMREALVVLDEFDRGGGRARGAILAGSCGLVIFARGRIDRSERTAMDLFKNDTDVAFPDLPRERPSSAAGFVPEGGSLGELRAAAEGCAGCELFRGATQTVFGEGSARALLMFVGEAPGDQEDRTGRPFVGPAGGLLARVLHNVGISRDQVYVTNAVKHFKYTLKGKRRLHVKPSAGEIQACRAWLLAELEAVRPEMIVCLGATAAQAFAGRKFSVTESHGQIYKDTPWGPWWMATLHPAALLRMPDEAARDAALAGFEEDMARAAEALADRRHARAS